jgi:hypothetical protein
MVTSIVLQGVAVALLVGLPCIMLGWLLRVEQQHQARREREKRWEQWQTNCKSCSKKQ